MQKSLLKILILFALFFTTSVNAEVNLSVCEYSDEYTEWLKLNDNEKSQSIMPPVCNSAGISANYNVGAANSVYTDSFFSLAEDGHLSSIKNQGSTMMCWAYATTESIESNLRKTSSIIASLSAGHIELATQNTAYNPNRLTFSRALNVGGNYHLSTAYVLNYWGPTTDKSSYSTTNVINIINGTSSLLPATVENETPNYNVNDVAYFINNSCTTDAKEEIKRYLVTNGALAATVYWANPVNDASINNRIYRDRFVNDEYYYYNGSAYTNINGEAVAANQDVNHGITIVGWDDSISRTNFSLNPGSDGAWLVKNSYGTSAYLAGLEYKVGNNGYYYISYEDANICNYLSGFYNVNRSISDNVYFHDDLGWNAWFEESVEDTTVYIASVFQNKTGSPEVLDKITFGASQLNQRYTIYYAPNGSIENYQGNIIASGIVDHIGYTTVAASGINVDTNRFSIVIKLEAPAGEKLQIAVMAPDQTSWWASAPIRNNASFVLDGTSWADLADVGAVNTIRAYTSQVKNNPGTITNPGGEVDNSGTVNLDNTNNNNLELTSNNVTNPATGTQNNFIFLGLLVLLILGFCLLKMKRMNIFSKI